MKGASVKLAILSFFSRHGLYFHHIKISPYWGPVQPFLNIDHDFGHICFLKKLWNFFVQNLGHILIKKSFPSACFFYWEISIYFCPLFVHFRILWDTLTYSTLVLPWDIFVDADITCTQQQISADPLFLQIFRSIQRITKVGQHESLLDSWWFERKGNFVLN